MQLLSKNNILLFKCQKERFHHMNSKLCDILSSRDLSSPLFHSLTMSDYRTSAGTAQDLGQEL
jgi:hypothetical protein